MRMRSAATDRLVVTVAALIWVSGTLLGLGFVGGQGAASQGEGLFSDHATLIAPHGPAFAIWSVLYLGLAVYVVWQWLPATDASHYARATRLPAAASLALNGLWLVTVWAGWIGVSVLVMAVLAASLGVILGRLARLPHEGRAADVMVALTFGAYLGWICVATCANVASWLVSLGVPAQGSGPVAATVAVLIVVVALAAFLLRRSAQPWFQAGLAAAVVWGLSWVAVGRLRGELLSAPVGYAALAAAVAVAGLGAWFARRGRLTATRN